MDGYMKIYMSLVGECMKDLLQHEAEHQQFEIAGTSILSSQIHSQTENLQGIILIWTLRL